MKKHFILVAVIGVLIAVGCSSPYSENIDEPIREDNKKAKEVIITATFDNQSDAQTKTVLNAEGKVEWLPADEIVIFSDGESAKFTSINTENARKANFRGTISFVTGATEGSDPDAFVYGLYPYDANATAAGGVITTTIPTAQIGLAGSFADDLALAVAKSVSTNLSFKNAYSGIDFEFSEEGYETVTLSSNNGEPIAGAVTISFGSDGVPVTTVDANGSSSITLTAPGGGTFETEKRYYILCAPQTLNGGYTLTAEKSTGRAVFERTSKKEFKRNVLTDVSGYLNERATFVESSNITFADSKVKEICVDPATGWDTNGDGELSYAEAAAVTDIGTVFKETEITSFDELKYFTSISSIPSEAFDSCRLLTNLSFPSQLTSVHSSAFRYTSSLHKITVPSLDLWFDVVCKSGPFYSSTASPDNSIKSGELYVNDNLITEITIPNGYASVPDYLCCGLDNLNTVIIPSDVTSIGQFAFAGCTGLTNIELPTGVASIGRSAFWGCTGLTNIELPTGVTYIGSSAFYGCTGLTNIELPTGVTTIWGRTFEGCTGLTDISIPEGVVSIYERVFYNCPLLKSISLPSTIEQLWLYTNYSESYGSLHGAFVGSSIESIECYDTILNRFTTDKNVLGGHENSGKLTGSILKLGFISAQATSYSNTLYSQQYDRIKSITLKRSGEAYSIPRDSFSGFSSLESISLETGLTNIDLRAFKDCIKLSSIDLPATLQVIGQEAFNNCTVLTAITIPEGVTSIDSKAFYGCSGLTSIQVNPTTPPTGGSSMFDNTNNAPIYVPSSSVNDYKTAEYWINYADRIQAMLEVAVTGVSFDIATLTLDANTSTTLVPIVAPENATDKTVTWTSSNPYAVTVDQSGTITAQNGGSSMITVTTIDGGYSASCVVTVKPNDIHFNPDSYIIYRKNQYMSEQQPNYYTFESHFDPFAAGQKVEFKFQIDSWSSTNSTVPLAGLEYSRFDLIIDNYSCFNYVTNGVNCNDVMTVTIDLTANKMTINGKTSTDVPSLQNEEDRYFFSCYDEYSDSGRYHIWTGTEEETKIYYIVVRDSDNVIIQEGYPDRAVNPETGNTEYCWCWRAADGTKTYNFANAAGTYGAYEGYIP